MPNPEPPAIAAFDPAAAGWAPYHDEGFIGLVGPFWTRQEGDHRADGAGSGTHDEAVEQHAAV